MTVTRTFKAFKAFKASKASSNGVGGVSGRREDDDAQLEGDPKPRSSSTGLSQQARQVFQEVGFACLMHGSAVRFGKNVYAPHR